MCASKPIQINDILKMFKSILKKSFKIKYKPKRRGEMEITYGSNLKLLKLLKTKNFIKFNVGLKRTILWYKNYPNKSFLELYKWV